MANAIQTLESLVPSIVFNSGITSRAALFGNFVEAGADNKWLITAAKIAQSLSLGLLTVWAVLQIFLAVLPTLPIFTSLGLGLVVITIPLITTVVKIIYPNNSRIASFEKGYSKMLKIINIAAGSFVCIAGMITTGIPPNLIALNALSVLSSAYLLGKEQKNQNSTF